MIKYNFSNGSDFTSYKTILDSYLMSINLDDFAQLSLPEMLSHIASNIHKAAKDSFGLKVTKNKQYNTQLPAHILKTIKKKKDTAKSLHVAILKGLCHNHTFNFYIMLLCILIHMEVMIILYSTYVFENFHFLQIPEVNPYLKTRFPDEKMIMKISFQTENFAQN